MGPQSVDDVEGYAVIMAVSIAISNKKSTGDFQDTRIQKRTDWNKL